MEFDELSRLYPGLNSERREKRSTEEMLGFLRGILVDGKLSDAEILATYNLLQDRKADLPEWLFSALTGRLCRIVEGGPIAEEDRAGLMEAMQEILGTGGDVLESRVSLVPLNKPEPIVIFPNRIFVLTGEFVHGPRDFCMQEILQRGGKVDKGVTRRTDYLVVGMLGSAHWVTSSFGRKIEKAVEYRDKKGINIAIISEKRWAEFL
jgi:hypothetical protein